MEVISGVMSYFNGLRRTSRTQCKLLADRIIVATVSKWRAPKLHTS